MDCKEESYLIRVGVKRQTAVIVIVFTSHLLYWDLTTALAVGRGYNVLHYT